jgi:hypothetical protein
VPLWHPDTAQLFANIAATLYDSNPLLFASTAGGCSVILSLQPVVKKVINSMPMKKIYSFCIDLLKPEINI